LRTHKNGALPVVAHLQALGDSHPDAGSWLRGPASGLVIESCGSRRPYPGKLNTRARRRHRVANGVLPHGWWGSRRPGNARPRAQERPQGGFGVQ
jgi:hypothetical protein